MTPRQRILEDIRQIAHRHELPLSAVMGRRKFRQYMPARRESYLHVLNYYDGNYARAARFFGRDHATLWYAINGRRK